MLSNLRQTIQTNSLLPAAAPVLVGVSGGVDSMVLLHTLHALGYQVQVAHVNYRMRDDASDADEALVVSYCDKLGVPCQVHRVSDTFLRQAKTTSFQAAARTERYTFFEEAAQAAGIKHVAVAHHQDDQAETVLLNLMRGSGAEGLAGMPYSRPLAASSDIVLVRPLLGLSREHILAYATTHEVPWREDMSNASTQYARNKVRHTLMPAIREAFGDGAVKNLATSANLLQGAVAHAIKPLLEEKLREILLPNHAINADLLAQEPVFWQTRLVLEACKRWFDDVALGRQHAEAICDLLALQVGRKVVFGSLVVWREREQLVFTRIADAGPVEADAYFLDAPATLAYPGGKMSTEILDKAQVADFSAGADTFYADANTLSFPLQLRRWEAGDRIVPFGMNGQKKVSDLLTDLKVPSYERKNVWVLLSDDEIIWVVGHRASELVRVGEATTRVCRCTLSRR